MSNDIDDFLNELGQNSSLRHRSVLAPYEHEILELKKRGCTESVILMFLEKKKGIKVAQPTLNWFINSRLKKIAAQQKMKDDQQSQQPPEVKPLAAPATKIDKPSVEPKSDEDDELARRPSWASKTPMSELI